LFEKWKGVSYHHKKAVVAQCRMVWYPSRRHFNGKD
jgi:hypothetical protein